MWNTHKTSVLQTKKPNKARSSYAHSFFTPRQTNTPVWILHVCIKYLYFSHSNRSCEQCHHWWQMKHCQQTNTTQKFPNNTSLTSTDSVLTNWCWNRKRGDRKGATDRKLVIWLHFHRINASAGGLNTFFPSRNVDYFRNTDTFAPPKVIVSILSYQKWKQTFIANCGKQKEKWKTFSFNLTLRWAVILKVTVIFHPQHLTQQRFIRTVSLWRSIHKPNSEMSCYP